MRRWLATISIAAQAACYSPPEPACGFICGSDGACPADYTCHADDRRCHADGTTATCTTGIDAAIDAGSGSGSGSG